MKLLRNRFIHRTISIFLLLVFVQSIVLPNYSYALTSGPHQPEYTSYEEPGATDMVNLLTGDFTTSIPILEVPGPEGSFSVPLTYNAGIGTDQQASWVGLGWTINAGAITRTYNEFPDDANGQSQNVTVKDLVGSRGWNANILGIGKFGWNNQVGHFGNLSLLSIVNANWSDGYSSVGILGINRTTDGVTLDPVQFTMGVATIISWGAVGAAAGAGQTVAGAIAKQAAVDLAIGAAMDGAISWTMGSGSPTAPNGYWQYSKSEKNNWTLKALAGFGVGVKEYKIWLDKTRMEDMYGTLYLGNAPTEPFVRKDTDFNLSIDVINGGTTEALDRYQKNLTSSSINKGAASDIVYHPDYNQELKEFSDINNPMLLGYDNFHVKAAGISGSISPYRLDVGTVALPRQMTPDHERLVPVKYLPNDNSGNAYKVPFIYQGQNSNAYFHHLGNATAVTSPNFYWGIDKLITNTNNPPNKNLSYVLNDVVLKGQRKRPGLPSTNKIPQGNYIEWLTNAEILSSTQYPSKFMDFFVGSDRTAFRTTPPVGSISNYSTTSNFSNTAIPISGSDISKISLNDYIDIYISYYNDATTQSSASTSGYSEVINIQVSNVNTGASTISIPISGTDGYNQPYDFTTINGKYADIEVRIKKTPQATSTIGGFCITGGDGSTYHFALPSYDYEQYTEIRDIVNPTSKRSIIRRNAPFANTWLLTGITGPDFVDRSGSSDSPNGVIDEGDWGYWVKFNYGLHISDYKWRMPYSGYKKASTTHESFTSGKKQLIYLNSIETRSHVALFVKSEQAGISKRLDGKSAETSVAQYPLQLNEIILMGKEQYNKLMRPTNDPLGGFGMNPISNKLYTVLTASSFVNGAMNYAINNCMKRIAFTYDNSLCKYTSNSTAPGGAGKLTLTRVSMLGRNNLKIVPDYKFEYANNPDYNVDYWDNWGMYNPNGTSSISTHNASSNDQHGSAWSLTKVTTPLGSEVNVNYERDIYSSVSGYPVLTNTSNFNWPNRQFYYPTDVPIQKCYISNPEAYAVGEQVYIQGYINYYCPSGQFQTRTYADYFTIQSKGADYINLGTDFMGVGNCSITNSGDYIRAESLVGTISKVSTPVRGGDIRVGSIVTKDESGNQNKIRYLYNDDIGNSSGVVSREVDGQYNYFYDYPGYPQTPVLYGKVTVLTGKLNTDTDFHTRQVYEFETPHYNLYTLTRGTLINKQVLNNYGIDGWIDYLTMFENQFVDKTSKIGQLKSIKVYNATNNLYSSSTLTYSDQSLNNPQILNEGINNYQGFYTGASLMFDRVSAVIKGGTAVEKLHKINKTSIVKYPSVVTKITNYKDGYTNEMENRSWDLITGMVLEQNNKSALGITMKTIITPAYKITGYEELGPKTTDVNNKNMLTQIASTYHYRITDVSGNISKDASGNAVGLINASNQTWKKSWANYRYNNGAGYVDAPEEPISAANKVWRKGSLYMWKGDFTRVNTNDGTSSIKVSDDFVFSDPSLRPLWQYTGEILRFDHFGMPLESNDLSKSIFSATKMGYDQRRIIAQASRAKYNEIAFSSAEDENTANGYFGGEVAKKDAGGNVSVIRGNAHTGDCSLSVSSGYGFVFKSTGLVPNKTYRASVWTNSLSGRLYYKLNGGSEVVPTATVSAKIGNWYLLNYENIKTGASFTSFEAGVKSVDGTTVLFDDFRFQPADAEMSCFVTNPLDFEYVSGQNTFEYVLDNNNLFTKYEYNEKGKLIKTYKESLSYGVKLVTESKQNYRRSNIDQ